MELQAVALLSALATTTFASNAAANRAAMAWAVVGVAAGLLGFANGASAAAVAGIAVTAAALRFGRPHWHAVAPLAAGAMGAAWAATLQAQGIALGVGLLLACAVASIANRLAARSPTFAPDALRDEAAVVIGIFGAAVLVGGELVAGWRTAAALAEQPLRGAETPVGIGLVAIVLAALALGAGYTLWTRR